HRWLELGHSTSEAPSSIANSFNPGERFAGHLKLFNEHLLNISVKNDKAVIISRQKKRLNELWEETSREATISQTPIFIEGTLSEGWVAKKDDGSALHLITDSEIFGWARPQPRQRIQQTVEIPEDAFADLQAGDWVVHSDFGVGKYTGLVRRQLEGTEREFLCIEYQGGDQIFVPIHQADRLTRYIGPDESPPSATHLGTSDWSNSKQQVKEAVRLVAKELLDLYARRQLARGFAFGKDTTWQQELEASFPYIETTDQSKAILETKQDMETPRPMDRLLCGDVGYGKTEVALRAAFKAVMDGKQVAMLVPTTVLAQQHYETFQQRLAAYPVVVEMLSRFRQPKAQDEILLKLGMGEIDIVIGTHRLIQADVQFKDLGLVIIDEEQRFGVAHKEHFKKLRTEVDVLTLTATPIPRTLYMALTGVRDISVINTPPAERLPVVTHIGPYSPKIVRQATLRELDR
ncbi:DEAD/DEAH box helicase, partial [bacterium]|nr:DEAD/DEAH box helicase [bacterium]